MTPLTQQQLSSYLLAEHLATDHYQWIAALEAALGDFSCSEQLPGVNNRTDCVCAAGKERSVKSALLHKLIGAAVETQYVSQLLNRIV